MRDTTRLVEDLEATEGVKDHPRPKNESAVGVEGYTSAYVDGNDNAGVRKPEEAHSTKDEDKDFASPTSRRTPELRKTIRSRDSGPRDGSLPKATVRKSTLSKTMNPIRGLADVPALGEIFWKIDSPAVHTRFCRKRKRDPKTVRTERSKDNPCGLETGGVLSRMEIRMD